MSEAVCEVCQRSEEGVSAMDLLRGGWSIIPEGAFLSSAYKASGLPASTFANVTAFSRRWSCPNCGPVGRRLGALP